MSKCKYCGSSSYGRITDSRHPKGVHVHTPDGKHCIYCGYTGYGRITDSRHPEDVHEIQ